MTARLRETYKSDVFTALKDKFNYANVNEVPKLVKITINMGLGEAKENSKVMESAIQELALISGQRPVVTKAKKSIANFKVRQGMPVGAKVTLRGDNMYVFADKFFNNYAVLLRKHLAYLACRALVFTSDDNNCIIFLDAHSSHLL